LKNKKVDVFWDTVYITFHSVSVVVGREIKHWNNFRIISE